MKEFIYKYSPIFMWILGIGLLFDAVQNKNVVNMVSPSILIILAIYITIVRKNRKK
ncbi:hypothetical protein LCIT_08540 [Leuconostoc citreum]|uniref:Uncharacterized protein n=1 Tax=Leuconostoc citreum TaxID=33964 RepID=A0A5A5U0V6_LEUCI|nr:hypothetical protein LCIT_08540 [Leuconostoc citreum]CCF25178.1 Protein of unknown function [Leuconostoc citreum LBAE C10]CDX66448.1 Protein of unknown function [Leuconostoc citreum]